MGTAIAAIDMTTENLGPAGDDVIQYTLLSAGNSAASRRLQAAAECADDISHLERVARHVLARLAGLRLGVEWTCRGQWPPPGHIQVRRGRGQALVSEELLDRADICPALQQVRSEAVPQCVRRHVATQAGTLPSVGTHSGHGP